MGEEEMVELTSINKESSTVERSILGRPRHSSGRLSSRKARTGIVDISKGLEDKVWS